MPIFIRILTLLAVLGVVCNSPAAVADDKTSPSPLPGVWSPIVGKRPAPFWRKGDAPTYAPPWYANVGKPTVEVARRPDESDVAAGERLYKALQNLKPGDHVVIHAGTYSIDRWLVIRGMGTPEKPIAISAAAGEEVTITRPDDQKNVTDIDAAEYLALRSVRIRGGSNAVKIYKARHILLYDLDVAQCTGSAITANAEDTSHLSIVDCEIANAGGHGEALYLGGHDGAKVTHHCAIVGNYIHDLVGPTVNQGDGIEIKQGSYANWVKYNYIHNTNYPGITLYGTGRGIADRNVVEENVVIDSKDYAMQICADCIIRSNLVVNSLPGKDAFMSKPETLAKPSNLVIVNNTFLARESAFNCRQWNAASAVGIVFANNALYSADGTALNGDLRKAIAKGNVMLRSNEAFADVDLEHGKLDIMPRSGSVLSRTGDAAWLPTVDLNGEARSPMKPDVGALIGQ